MTWRLSAYDRCEVPPVIYLDHAATSPMRPEAWEAMRGVLGRADYNPASMHSAGGLAASSLEEARRVVSAALDIPRSDLVFTGGGTQSDNLAVLGFARARPAGARLLVSAIEHKAVLEAARRAGLEGCLVEILPVDANGWLDPQTLEDRLARGPGSDLPTLVSVMWANSEVGTVQPIAELLEVAHRWRALFHTDAVQAVGKIPVSVQRVPVDLLTLTAHKLGGPVGIGALARPEAVDLEPLSYGGSQERSLWPGTQNPVGAAGFAEAVRLALSDLPDSSRRWKAMRDRLEGELRESVPGLRVHAEGAEERLPHLLSVGVAGCDQAALLTALDMAGLAVSAGSACASGASTGSHVLDAMGVRPEGDYAVLRFSFGPHTAESDLEAAVAAVTEAVGRLRGRAS